MNGSAQIFQAIRPKVKAASLSRDASDRIGSAKAAFGDARTASIDAGKRSLETLSRLDQPTGTSKSSDAFLGVAGIVDINHDLGPIGTIKSEFSDRHSGSSGAFRKFMSFALPPIAEHLSFLVWMFGFVTGMRLTDTEAGV